MTDDELMAAFEGAAIGRGEWTHRAHVKVGYLYVRRFGFEEAVRRMGEGIRKLNAANGVPEGPTMGYNETTTVAFMHLIAAVAEAYGGVFPVATAEEFCAKHPELMSPQVLRFFYSPERRMHPEAKVRFVEPDLARLPRIGEKSKSSKE